MASSTHSSTVSGTERPSSGRALAPLACLLALALGALAAGGWALWRGRPESGVLIASYSTSLSGRTPNQRTNIALAAQRCDGVRLAPGEVYSFARAVGEVSAGTGFVRGLAIRDGEPASEDGGGICQLTSTVYNAALRANLQVLERRKHLFPVHSIPPGLDASFATGHVDLRFRNTLSQPIRIETRVEGSRLVARIRGVRAEPARVEIIRAVQRVIPPERVVQSSALLRRGERRLRVKGRLGYEVEVWRVVHTGAGAARRERLSRDRYAPVNQLLWVGTR